jgi:hypothetical protein
MHKNSLVLFLLVFATGCTTRFIPDVDENKEVLVVEGMITDQNRVNKIKLTRSLPLGKIIAPKPVKGAIVTITDDKGPVTTLKEGPIGTYSTDSTSFRGKIGHRYYLSIRIGGTLYSTVYTEMKPVPPIDSVYYEKVNIPQTGIFSFVVEGCRIYVDSHDPSGNCLYYRWNFSETWEFRLPWPVPNNICWKTETSDKILIKSTAAYSQAKVTRFPLTFINNSTDRLNVRYSVLVNQYSLTEAEYNFWEKVKNISENVGSLYDISPMSIRGNVNCVTNPDEPVLGYFSVSAVEQKRLFIKDTFLGKPNYYSDCISDTVRGKLPPGINVSFWVLQDFSIETPSSWVITYHKECADCTTKGSNVRPPYWPKN